MTIIVSRHHRTSVDIPGTHAEQRVAATYLDRDTRYAIRRAALRCLASSSPRVQSQRVLWTRPYQLPWPLCLHPSLSAWLVRIGTTLWSGYDTQTIFVLHDMQGFTLAHPYTYGGIDLFSTRGWYVDSLVFPRRVERIATNDE